MTDEEIELVRDRREILALAGMDLYQSELSEKLDLYKSINPRARSKWTEGDLDIHLRKRISVNICDNEFQKGPKVKGRKPKIKTDKEMISLLSEELNLEIMAVKYLYVQVKEALGLSESKDETRNFLSAQVYAHIDDLDLKIEMSETEKDQQKWYELKMKAIDQLAKIRNLEDKQSINNTTVHGNVNSQQNVDKQIVVSEEQMMLKLMNKICPQNHE